MTLAEGLAEMRAANPELLSAEELAQQEELGGIGPFIAAHDACHVVFGLDTSLPDETLADTWTFAGTDVRWAELRSYFNTPAQRDLFWNFFREIGFVRTVWGALSAVPRVLRAIWAARKMSRKWALHGWRDYLDVPLAEIRRSHNIRLV